MISVKQPKNNFKKAKHRFARFKKQYRKVLRTTWNSSMKQVAYQIIQNPTTSLFKICCNDHFVSILEKARPLHVYLHIVGIFSFIGKKPKEHGKTITTHFYWLIIFQYRKLKISADKKSERRKASRINQG